MSWTCYQSHHTQYCKCPELNHHGLIQAISTRKAGNMALHTGDDPVYVVKNRERFLAALGLDLGNLVAAEQVHGTAIQVVTKDMNGAGAHQLHDALPATDGLVTRDRGIILAIFTADCLPVFLYDSHTPAIGIVHAGWRGTVNGIVEIALQRMVDQFGTDPADCWVAFGPGIGRDCFQVDPSVAKQFQAVYPDSVLETEDGYRVDLEQFNIRLLEQAGVLISHIFPSQICTACQTQDFYSYRAGRGQCGRMMGIVTLK